VGVVAAGTVAAAGVIDVSTLGVTSGLVAVAGGAAVAEQVGYATKMCDDATNKMLKSRKFLGEMSDTTVSDCSYEEMIEFLSDYDTSLKSGGNCSESNVGLVRIFTQDILESTGQRGWQWVHESTEESKFYKQKMNLTHGDTTTNSVYAVNVELATKIELLKKEIQDLEEASEKRKQQ
jgi:hypothetical protein